MSRLLIASAILILCFGSVNSVFKNNPENSHVIDGPLFVNGVSVENVNVQGDIEAVNFFGNGDNLQGLPPATVGGWIREGTEVKSSAAFLGIGVSSSIDNEKARVLGKLKVSQGALLAKHIGTILENPNGTPKKLVTIGAGGNFFNTNNSMLFSVGNGKKFVWSKGSNKQELMTLNATGLGVGVSNPTEKMDVQNIITANKFFGPGSLLDPLPIDFFVSFECRMVNGTSCPSPEQCVAAFISTSPEVKPVPCNHFSRAELRCCKAVVGGP